MSSDMSVSILAPADVSPGLIILAPLSMNLIAPLSTCNHGNINGSTHKYKERERARRERERERER